MERLGLLLNDGSDNPPDQVLIRLTGQHGHGDAHQSANDENDSNLTGVDSKNQTSRSSNLGEGIEFTVTQSKGEAENKN